jgi:hypothetical protein
MAMARLPRAAVAAVVFAFDFAKVPVFKRLAFA